LIAVHPRSLFSTAITSAEDIERHLRQTFWLNQTVQPFVELKRLIEFSAPEFGAKLEVSRDTGGEEQRLCRSFTFYWR
jgi:hypothetical protein